MGSTKARIRDWKGLLHDRPRNIKVQVFLGCFLVASAMTFTQFGFIGVGADGNYLGYAMGLLAPIAAISLLLGKGLGALEGALTGLVLYIHAQVQPLNPVERYFVSGLNSVVLFAYAGFLMGLIFAVALRNSPQGIRRKLYLGFASLGTSILVSIAFLANVFIHIIAMTVLTKLHTHSSSTETPREWVRAVEALGGIDVQCLLDFVLIIATILLLEYILSLHLENRAKQSIRVTFDAELFVAVFWVFCVLSAVSFVSITTQTANDTHALMTDEIQFIGDQLSRANKTVDQIVNSVDLPEDMSDSLRSVINSSYTQSFIKGYSLDRDGTVAIFQDGKVLVSNSAAYPEGATTEEVFGDNDKDLITNIAQTGEAHEILYTTTPYDATKMPDFTDYSTSELGYICAVQSGNNYVVMAKPFSKIFANRQATMSWSTVLSILLLATVYMLASKLLDHNVIKPIDRTNESLARITDGDLQVKVDEEGSVEFASLSRGINTTVGALKGWIDEAETRMEQELATAKAIQKSALPRVFPPFPEVDKFDIFASMDAAKEVGGDFYDYFLIDDHTLGFLIADVSGKGVPGALFMMAAKTELENYMSTGMELSQAIATANSRLCANNDAGMFVTVWAATLDYNTGELTYCNAGHNFPLLRHGAGGEWEWLKKKCGLFLGTFETAKYRQQTLTLHPGDELLLYTDGVNEAFNTKDQEYGNDRLERFLNSHADMHSREIVRSLRADVANWAFGAEQSDDITILALEYGVAPEVTGTITVPAVLKNLDAAISLVSTELEGRLCPLDAKSKVEIAIEELFVNICRYAYADQDKPGKVKIRYAYGTNPSSITVELRDTGIPFNPFAEEKDALPTFMDDEVGGLGLFMVKRTMDDYTYMRSGDTNVVVIKKGW